jgi:uncharacterized protein YodC (DUF2158 family)
MTAEAKPASFAIGDVVRLKSGGHDMTVSEVDSAEVTCIWSDGKKTRKERFSRELLAGGGSGKPQSLSIHFTPSPADIDDVVRELRELPDAGSSADIMQVTEEQVREILVRRIVHPRPKE